MKPVVWVGSSRKDARAFPQDARARAGYEIHRVQLGLEPTDWKPMGTAGECVREVRIHTDREHRLIYVAKFEDAVFVLHAFEKKTRKTTRADLDLARRRYRQVLIERSARGRKAEAG